MRGNHYDLIVIGTGPAGEGAAMKAAKDGKRVAVVERYTAVGGACTHWTTIPSKALRRAIYHTNITFENPIYKRLETQPRYSFPDLLASAAKVIREQTELRQSFYDHNNVRLLEGQARFADPHTLTVEKQDGAREEYTADGVVIAVGSRPYRPADVDFRHPRIFDSDTILTLKHTPRSITIYGAGVVGCEYASMFANMKIEVNLINTREKLLTFLDDEIIDALSYHFADKGILIRHNEEYAKVEPQEDSVVLTLKSGKKIRSDVFLWANGRTGNSDNLGLEALGVVPDKRGNLAITENFQVKKTPNGVPPGGGGAGGGEGGEGQAAIGAGGKGPEPTGKPGSEFYPHIYAAGDIVGFPSLASASYDQGRFAATHFAEGKADYKLVRDIPTGIYTSPEISSLGKTEAELTAEKTPYEVGKAMFKHLARAQIGGIQVGMLKLLFHRETLALLGIHCFGENASEIIHIGQAIMTQPAPNNTLHYFTRTTFNYPTMAEAYRVAALNGLDRVF